MGLTVKQCARVAYDKGYEYFAIQYYGECWGGQDAGKNYAKHGKSDGCWVFDSQSGHGVGGVLTNFVYRISKVCMKNNIQKEICSGCKLRSFFFLGDVVEIIACTQTIDVYTRRIQC